MKKTVITFLQFSGSAGCKLIKLIPVLLLTSGLPATAALGGAISWNPPSFMSGSGGQRGGLADGYQAKFGTNGAAGVGFQITSAGAVVTQSSRPPVEIRDLTELKGYLERRYPKGQTNFTNISMSDGKFSGREAVIWRAQVAAPGVPFKWLQETYTVWETNAALRFLCVRVDAEKKNTFDTLVKSLEGAKITPGAEEWYHRRVGR